MHAEGSGPVYTCRENALFSRLDDACQDYTDEEILKAMGRKLHWMSYDPRHQVPAHAHFGALTEGHQLLRRYFLAGCQPATALAIVAGGLASIVAHGREGGPAAGEAGA